MEEKIQIILFVVCISALIFIIVNSRRRDAHDISKENMEYLRTTKPQKVDEETVRNIKKKRWIPIFLALLFFGIIKNPVGSQWYKMRQQQIGDNIPFERLKELFIERMIVELLVVVVGILLIVGWVIYDIIKTKQVDNKVRIPAYVQSTFVHPKARTKTAQLIYYDYKKDKYRMKRVSVDEYETEHPPVYSQDKVWIIAMENRNSVKYISLYT